MAFKIDNNPFQLVQANRPDLDKKETKTEVKNSKQKYKTNQTINELLFNSSHVENEEKTMDSDHQEQVSNSYAIEQMDSMIKTDIFTRKAPNTSSRRYKKFHSMKSHSNEHSSKKHKNKSSVFDSAINIPMLNGSKENDSHKNVKQSIQLNSRITNEPHCASPIPQPIEAHENMNLSSKNVSLPTEPIVSPRVNNDNMDKATKELIDASFDKMKNELMSMLVKDFLPVVEKSVVSKVDERFNILKSQFDTTKSKRDYTEPITHNSNHMFKFLQNMSN